MFVTLFFILISLNSSLCPSTLGGLYGHAGLLSGDGVGKNMARMSAVKLVTQIRHFLDGIGCLLVEEGRPLVWVMRS